MDEYYKILGVNPDATNDEIEEAYYQLRSKYSKDRFAEGEKGNLAAKNLTKLEEAYAEIMEMRNYNTNNSFSNEDNSLEGVKNAISNGNLQRAQEILDSITIREAEWHYLQSVVFFKKNWSNESKKQLEIAMSMDPSNKKYKDAYEKLIAKMQFSNNNFNGQFQSGNANYNGGYNGGNYQDNRQMGGDGCLDFCTAYCCAELMCSLCCGR